MSTKKKPDLVELFEEELRKLLVDIAYQPLLYFSEKTLQFRLSAQLLRIPAFSEPKPTDVCRKNKKALERISANLSETRREAYRVPPLQMEYGINGIKGARIDLAILDPSDIQTIVDSESFKNDSDHYLKPLIGTEFYTEKSGETKKEIRSHLTNDARKTRECQHGYVVNVFRNHRLTRRRTQTADKTEKKLNRFKNEMEAHREEYHSIAWIGMIVHLAFAEVDLFTNQGRWDNISLASCTRQQIENAVRKLFPSS